MKKTPTAKEMIKKRIRNNKLLKTPKAEPELRERTSIAINIKKYETHNREIKDDGLPNPYALPNRMRVFTKQSAPRKIHPLPDIVDDIYTVCDIHKEFFTVVEGRPLRQFDDIKVYMKNIRDLVDYRTNAGFIKDEMQKIDHNFREETSEYEKILRRCNTCRSNYVQFLKRSFALAHKSQDEAENVEIQLDNICDQLEEYSFQYVRLRNGLAVVMGNYEKLVRYKHFLTSLAPPWWQKQFDDQSEDQVAKIRARLSSSLNLAPGFNERSDVSLTCLKPVIYFTDPSQLMSIYDTMSRQGQHHLAVVNHTSGILASARKLRRGFENTLKKSCSEMEEDVERYSKIVKAMEEKEIERKTAFYKVLNSDFKQLYADYDNIKLHTCVQYTYSQIFGQPEDVKDKTETMMRRLEGLYLSLSSKLDFLDVNVVNAATNQFFAQDIEIMTKAQIAHRQLQMCDILKKALYTSFEPSRRKHKKGL